MIPLNDIIKLFSFDLQNEACIEIEFNVIGCSDYQHCWMGKMPKPKPLRSKRKHIYWFGLANDGSKAYDYDNFFDFSTAPVFDGKTLKEIWDHVDILSIDGCDPKERLTFYLNDSITDSNS